MLSQYKNPQGLTCISGTPEDLDFVVSLLRARLHALLGPQKGELFLKKIPAYRALSQVRKEILMAPEV
jgi:hypothetical protein